MAYFISYFLRSFGISAVVTIFYWILLQNKRMHQFNRAFLLSGFLLSLVVPLLYFPGFHIPDSGLLQILYEHSGTPFNFIRNPELWIGIAFASVSLILFARMLIEIIQLLKLRKVSGYTKMDGFNFILTNHPKAPFSFLNNLFWRSDISPEDGDGKKIMQHELVHIHQKHSYEILFSQIIVSLFWMNPAFRIMQYELRLVHEFIADELSIPEGDTDSFARVLLRSHNQVEYLNTVNGFFQSSVKRRLAMILHTDRTRVFYFKKLASLPLVVLMVILFSAPSGTKQTIDRSQNRKQWEEKLAAEKEMKLQGEHQRVFKRQ